VPEKRSLGGSIGGNTDDRVTAEYPLPMPKGPAEKRAMKGLVELFVDETEQPGGDTDG